MDEEEFFESMNLRPFGTGDAMRWEAQFRGDIRLHMTLGSALWGKTSDDLRRQLLAPHPDIPAGFDLADFRNLLQWTAQLAAALAGAKKVPGLSFGALSAPTIFIGKQSFTVWEARCEIVRRAVDFLENR